MSFEFCFLIDIFRLGFGFLRICKIIEVEVFMEVFRVYLGIGRNLVLVEGCIFLF